MLPPPQEALVPLSRKYFTLFSKPGLIHEDEPGGQGRVPAGQRAGDMNPVVVVTEGVGHGTQLIFPSGT